MGDDKLHIDLNDIPDYVYSVIIEHYKRVQPNNKKRKIIERSFKQKSNGSYSLVGQFNKELDTLIKEALQVISLQPAFTQKDIINELCKVIDNAGFNDSENLIRDRSNEITLCILSMLHQSYFELSDGNSASAQVLNGQFVPDKKAKMSLAGRVKPNPQKPAILFTLIESEIDAKDYFAESMVKQPENNLPFLTSNYDENSHLETIRNREGILIITKIE